MFTIVVLHFQGAANDQSSEFVWRMKRSADFRLTRAEQQIARCHLSQTSLLHHHTSDYFYPLFITASASLPYMDTNAVPPKWHHYYLRLPPLITSFITLWQESAKKVQNKHKNKGNSEAAVCVRCRIPLVASTGGKVGLNIWLHLLCSSTAVDWLHSKADFIWVNLFTHTFNKPGCIQTVFWALNESISCSTVCL